MSRRPPFREHELDVGTHRVLVRDLGDDESAACFVLVHGIGVSSGYFLPLARTLAVRARVVALDLPGFGGSSKPREVLTMSDLADVVGAVADRLGVRSPVLVGHSMGCQVTMELDGRRPGWARGLVLVGPTVDPGKRSLFWHVVQLTHNAFYEPARVNYPMVKDYLRCGVVQYVKTLGPMLKHRIETRLAETRTPATVVRGARDRVVLRSWAMSVTRMLHDADLVEIAGQAHAVHVTESDEVAALCLGLLER